jgi:hypothetical protein
MVTASTGESTQKHTFPFAGQIPHGYKPLCQQTFSKPLALNSSKKEPEFKARGNKILHTTKSIFERSIFFL